MANASQIDNTIYDRYGEKWYTAVDDPVALLRAENKIKTPWVLKRIEPKSSVLDVGCGAGFLTNELALCGHHVTGVDSSASSLAIARQHDATKTVNYIEANAYKLPFDDNSFNVVCAMDFLEHIDNPSLVIQEISRVLRPGGKFIFHTFNRNFFSWFIIIKMVEWFIPNTPKNMHVLRLFIKPRELEQYCENSGMEVLELTGIRPVVNSIPVRQLFSGRVPTELRFEITSSLLTSYMGLAKKCQNGSATL